MTPKEKAYLESFIDGNALLNSDVMPLDDGDAYATDYVGGSTKVGERGFPLRWGRVVRNVTKSVLFDEPSEECAVATITRTIEGVLKISAPYQLSTRMRHAIIEKPFTEHCVRKARFLRIGRTKDPSKNWKLNAVSLVKGGTPDGELLIDELTFRAIPGETISLKAPNENIWPFGQDDPRIATVEGETDVDVAVKLKSEDIEPTMVVLRSGYKGKWGQRTLLPLKSENRSGNRYIHTYESTVRAQARPGAFHAVVEAIDRETLCDVDAPVSTSFWGVPYVIQ